MIRALDLIGAPSSAGAYAPGQEKAPAALRRHGLVEALTRAGHHVHDRGDVPGFRWRPDLSRPDAMNLDAVRGVAVAVADQVAETMAAHRSVLVLGGDCTVELGTVAGALRDGGSVGLVYIDFDADLNTPQTSDGALDWTGVAHLLGIPGAAAALRSLGPRRPMLAASDILLFAIENITPAEDRTISALGLQSISLGEVKRSPSAAATRAVAWATQFDRLLVHLDVDVLDFADFPIAENIERRGGLTFDELADALPPLLASPNWRALTLTEVNPDHAPDEQETFCRLIDMLAATLPTGS
jgi:arginase